MNNDAFDQLKMDFPIWELRNTRNYAIQIMLADGDEVQVQPNGNARINAASMIQLPDFTSFKMLSPTMSDIIKSGVLSSAPQDQPVFVQSAPEPQETFEVMPEPTYLDSGSEVRNEEIPDPQPELPKQSPANIDPAPQPDETSNRATPSSSLSTSSKSSKNR
jgi:hypothetical protein